MTSSNFKKEISIEKRKQESQHILSKYPERVPIICEPSSKQSKLPVLDKKKYLVPRNLGMGQFIFVIRKRLNIPATEALFFFTENHHVPPVSQPVSQLYDKYRNEDGFLYIAYSSENTFGDI